MAHPSRAKGTRHELNTEATLTVLLAGTGLTVEKTRAGYQRDGGDLLILTPDRTVLFVVQCKDVAVKDWRFPEWLRDLVRQRDTSHTSRGFLSVKRPRVLDAAHAYAVCDLAAMAALVRELWSLRTIIEEMGAELGEARAELSKGELARVDAAMSTSSKTIMNGDGPDPDVLQDPPGTVRGRQVYPWHRSGSDPLGR